MKHAKITQHKRNRRMLHTKNFHSDLKATFTYPLIGYVGSFWMPNPAAFGWKTLRQLLQTGHQTLQFSYKKIKNKKKKKEEGLLNLGSKIVAGASHPWQRYFRKHIRR
jgi:hypothetical protein